MPDSAGKACFVDTNVWLYALIDSGDAAKSDAARKLLQSVDAIVSAQVIHEVCSNLLKKAGFSEGRVRDLIIAFHERQLVVDVTLSDLITASGLREHLSLSYWDSLIVSAALGARADILYTEDMQHGLIIAGRLQIVNPFQSEKG